MTLKPFSIARLAIFLLKINIVFCFRQLDPSHYSIFNRHTKNPKLQILRGYRQFQYFNLFNPLSSSSSPSSSCDITFNNHNRQIWQRYSKVRSGYNSQMHMVWMNSDSDPDCKKGDEKDVVASSSLVDLIKRYGPDFLNTWMAVYICFLGLAYVLVINNLFTTESFGEGSIFSKLGIRFDTVEAVGMGLSKADELYRQYISHTKQGFLDGFSESQYYQLTQFLTAYLIADFFPTTFVTVAIVKLNANNAKSSGLIKDKIDISNDNAHEDMNSDKNDKSEDAAA